MLFFKKKIIKLKVFECNNYYLRLLLYSKFLSNERNCINFPVAPASISISGFSDGSVVKVPSGKPFSLECLIENARPAPTATWYHEGIELIKGKKKYLERKAI